jgi:Transcriptional regulator, AbiEi antitoxin/Protein of unknown function (DUF559)
LDEAIDRRIAALAKRQRGYVTRPQLMHLGLGSEAIKYRLGAGRLLPVYAGVYAVGHLPMLPQDRAFGALLACGPGAVLSHGSAATVWGVFKQWEMPFEVTARSAHRRPGLRVHRASLLRTDITRQVGLRVTSPARTVIDVAPRLTNKALRRAVNELQRSGHLRMHELASVLARCPRHPGAAPLRPFLETSDGPTRSDFEDDFLAFTVRFGLPRPQVNVLVHGYEVDAWFPQARVIVELDGWRDHSRRDRFEADRDRDAEMLARGIVTMRITWERFVRFPEREAERLRRVLRSRDAA